MESPSLRTLTNFLRQVQRKAPANFSTLCAEHNSGYGMVNRFLRYCLGRGFIAVESRALTAPPIVEAFTKHRGLRLVGH